jgi:hypothetical protein
MDRYAAPRRLDVVSGGPERQQGCGIAEDTAVGVHARWCFSSPCTPRGRWQPARKGRFVLYAGQPQPNFSDGVVNTRSSICASVDKLKWQQVLKPFGSRPRVSATPNLPHRSQTPLAGYMSITAKTMAIAARTTLHQHVSAHRCHGRDRY